MPVSRIAEMFRVDRKTVDRWLSGESAIPPSIGTECYLLSGRIQFYQLVPLRAHLQSVHWRASTYQGTLTVRAPNERMARLFGAAQYTRTARRGSDGDEAPQIPWVNPVLVKAVPVPFSEVMPDEGSLGVIGGPERSMRPNKKVRSSQPNGEIVRLPKRAKGALRVRALGGS